MSDWFFNNLLDTYVITFHRALSDIWVKRLNKVTDEYDLEVRVPIMSENKFKQYFFDNANIGAFATKLPLLGISEPHYERFYEMSKSPMKGITYKNKEDKDLSTFFQSPIPIKMTFTVTAFSKFVADLRQITEQFIGNFSEFNVVPINIVPEYSIYFEMPFRLFNWTDDSIYNTVTVKPDDRVLNMNFDFEVYGYIFRNQKTRKLIRRTKVKDDNLQLIRSLSTSQNDKYPENVNQFVEVSNEMIRTFEYFADSDKQGITQIENISTQISTYGETIYLKDSDGNMLDFVFEYSNGEFYGCDQMIPSNRSTITKTGNIAFKIKDMLEGDKYYVYIYSSTEKSYCYPDTLFNFYNDFNRRRVDRLTFVNKTEANLAYSLNGCLVTRLFGKTAIGDWVKVVPDYSITATHKQFYLSTLSFTEDADRILFGLLDENENYLYIDGRYRLWSKASGGAPVLLNTFTYMIPPTSFYISAVQNGIDWEITMSGSIDATPPATGVGPTYVFNTTVNYVNMFTSTSETPLFIDVMYSRRIF